MFKRNEAVKTAGRQHLQDTESFQKVWQQKMIVLSLLRSISSIICTGLLVRIGMLVLNLLMMALLRTAEHQIQRFHFSCPKAGRNAYLAGQECGASVWPQDFENGLDSLPVTADIVGDDQRGHVRRQ